MCLVLVWLVGAVCSARESDAGLLIGQSVSGVLQEGQTASFTYRPSASSEVRVNC